jgi:acyl carrier protein
MADALQRTVAEVFQIPAESVTDDASQDTLQGWDSLGMLRLLKALEERFGLEFDLMEIASFRTIGNIREYLLQKGVNPGG